MMADAECRMFWLASRFAEMPEKGSKQSRPLRLVPMVPATPDAIREAYSVDLGFVKDSLWFFHRQGHYIASDPVTPLVLSWRDAQVSRYVVDTPDVAGKTIPEKQKAVLEVRRGGALRTADRVVVACLPLESEYNVMKQDDAKVRGHGPLLQCLIDGVDLESRRVLGLQPQKFIPSTGVRVWPDSWGRIVFQHLHRTGATEPISIERVIQGAFEGKGCLATATTDSLAVSPTAVSVSATME